MFENVIVKTPGKSYVNGLTTSDLGAPDYVRLLEQHAAYIEALKACGVEVTQLPASEEYPDSTFVEDAAVVTPEFAIITNPGAKSRNGEKEEIEAVLKKFYLKFHYIKSPGTLDGGDVLQVDKHFYVGISERTNREGAQQFKNIVETEGYTVTIVELRKFFHLKTGIAYLGNNTIAAAGEFLNHLDFSDYEKVEIPDADEYSANCIKVNGYVIIPKGFEDTKRKLAARGLETIELEMSEFQKHDGGLSCLSLRF
jgi:dimethylargininase